jgi:hypothetical protein
VNCRYSNSIVKWTYSCSNDSNQKALSNVRWEELSGGIPQGPAISPVLFNIFMQDLYWDQDGQLIKSEEAKVRSVITYDAYLSGLEEGKSNMSMTRMVQIWYSSKTWSQDLGALRKCSEKAVTILKIANVI